MADQVTIKPGAVTPAGQTADTKGQSGRTKGRSRLNDDDDGWAVFGGYMNAKKMKLNEQFNSGCTAGQSHIFAGVAVYVNGYTNPSSDELRRILLRNGGRYEMYLSKTRVTHIVATNLPNSKYRLAETLPVVKPEWITDSEAAGKRLSHIPYLLLGNRSKLQSGLRTSASVTSVAKTPGKLETHPSAHDYIKETEYLKVEPAEPVETNMFCDFKFLPQGDLKCHLSKVEHSAVAGYPEWDLAKKDCQVTHSRGTASSDCQVNSKVALKMCDSPPLLVSVNELKTSKPSAVFPLEVNNYKTSKQPSIPPLDVNDLQMPKQSPVLVSKLNELHTSELSLALPLEVNDVHTSKQSQVLSAKTSEQDGDIVKAISHLVKTLNTNNRVSIIDDKVDDGIDDGNDDDDDDVVYNSEEDIKGQEDKAKSTVTLLSQNEASPYKRSRVYSCKRFTKCNSGSFESPGVENSSSCDGFMDHTLLSCQEPLFSKAICRAGVSQKLQTSLLTDHVKYNNYAPASGYMPHQCSFENIEDISTVCNTSLTPGLFPAPAGAPAGLTKKPVSKLTISNISLNGVSEHQHVLLKQEHRDPLAVPCSPRVFSASESPSSVLGSKLSTLGQAPDYFLASSLSILDQPNSPSKQVMPRSSGTLPISFGDQTSSSSRQVTPRPSGTLPVSLGDQTSSSSRQVTPRPTLPVSLGDQTSSSSRQVTPRPSGTLPVSLRDQTSSSSRQVTPRSSGTLPVSFGDQTSSSSRQVTPRSSGTFQPTNLSVKEVFTKSSVTLPNSTLDPPYLPLIPASNRSTSALPTSGFEPEYSSTKQTPQGPPPSSTSSSSCTMAKAGDKNFLSEFYSNSRLHHIATWGAEFKAYVSKIQKSGSHLFPGREKLRQLRAENDRKLGHLETSARPGSVQKTIMHIDMDCFFVSVGLLARPDLKGKPVAVTHSRGRGAKSSPDANLTWEQDQWMKRRTGVHLKGQRAKSVQSVEEGETAGEPGDEKDTPSGLSESTHSFQSMAEIASCSYEARKAGVKNGMFMGTALKLCPNLQTIPYDFHAYNRVSRILYDVVASYTHDIEAVSCDELLIDCTDILSDTGSSATEFAQVLRAEILEMTGCSSSAGIGPNILLARLATRLAKPNGQFEVSMAEAKDFIKDQSVSNLPGVGYSLCRKLTLLSVHTCGDLQRVALLTLQQEFGTKTGEMLHRFSMGQDSREVKGDKQRKSVSAEVNYGIRFLKDSEAMTFIHDLSGEVKRRLDAIGVKGRSITLKLMVRRPDAPVATAKFMGHGICNTYNKSSNLPMATNDQNVIAREVLSLYRAHKVLASDVRGIGIHINKLERAVTSQAMSFGTRMSGYQDITSFTVQKTSSATPATAVANASVMTTASSATSTKSPTSTTYSKVMPLSSFVASHSSTNTITSVPFTSLRGSRREFINPQTSKFEANDTLSPARLTVATHTTQNCSPDSENCLEQGLESPSDPQFHEAILNPDPTFHSVNLNSAVGNHIAAHQQINSPTCSKSAAVNFDVGLCQPGPSWKVDVVEELIKKPEQKFDGNTSYLSESQIDSDVLLELPPEIAQEVLSDLRVRKQQKQSLLEAASAAVVPEHVADDRHAGSPVQDSDRCVGAAGYGGLPSLSQLDLACFRALPSYLQDELRAEYVKQEVTSQRSADKKATLVEGAFTHLRSPTKDSRDRLKSSKQASKRGRRPGKGMLSFGNSKQSGRGNRNQQKLKLRLPHPDSNLVVCIDSDDDASSRDIYVNEDTSDIHCPPDALRRHICSSSPPDRCMKSAASVWKDQDKPSAGDVTFCGATSLDDVRKLIKEWMVSCSEPQDDDVSMVTEYLTKLVLHRHLDQVFCLLKFLSRRSQSQNSPQWKDNLLKITSCVQNVVSACYGATLKLSSPA